MRYLYYISLLIIVQSKKAGKYLERKLKEDDIVFVKGSQIMRMERAVEEIMAHPENKRRMLARQGEEWKKL